MDNSAPPGPSQPLPPTQEKPSTPPQASAVSTPPANTSNTPPAVPAATPPQTPPLSNTNTPVSSGPPTFWQKHGTWINWLLFIVLIIELLAGGLYAHTYASKQQQSQVLQKPTQTPVTPTILPTQSAQENTPPSNQQAGVVCTMDAKECPDGSWVGRTGPNCEFAACPGR